MQNRTKEGKKQQLERPVNNREYDGSTCARIQAHTQTRVQAHTQTHTHRHTQCLQHCLAIRHGAAVTAYWLEFCQIAKL